MGYIPLQLNITQGAAAQDPDFPGLKPVNVATVYGAPELALNVTMSGDGRIVEAATEKTYEFTLDDSGVGQFQIALDLKQGTRSISAVTVTDVNNISNSLTKTVSFSPYKIGMGHIHAYNYTVGAPSDGVTPCCIYVITSQMMDIGKITKLVARVDGDAFIVGSPESSSCTTIPLDADGCGTVCVASITDAFSRVTVALPESPDGEYIQIDVNFISIDKNDV